MEAGIQSHGFPDVRAKFEEFFRRYYDKEIMRVIKEYPEVKSLVVDFQDINKYDVTLADELLNNPEVTISEAEEVLKGMDLFVDLPSIDIHVRFDNLPESNRLLIRDIRSDHIGRLLAIEGIVRKATDVRPKLVVGAFECQRCGHVMKIQQKDVRIKEPFLCEDCETRGPFKLLVHESKFINFQKVLIQENLEDLRGGEHPKQISIFLEDDLTGKIIPGDRIESIGVLKAVRKRFKERSSRVFEIFIETNFFKPVELEWEEVEVSKEDEKRIKELAEDPKIYEKIKESIAPHIYGYNYIKEAIMYQLFSSPMLVLPDGGNVRGDSHILILGEPATGKSEVLQYVSKELAPRGIYTTGKGTSAAGLTATAVKDEFGDGGWSLEAGALVLADKGIACIDEFDKMEAGDRSAIHESMEQQSVSIAKAGILATFRSRCSILAAANPKFGRFDKFRAISEQINLSPTVLSRFDLIFFVQDEIEETAKVAKHILDTVVSPDTVVPQIEPEVLRKYVSYARKNVFPILSDEARAAIERYYVDMRTAKGVEDSPIPLTARQLWAVIRLSGASARVRLSDEATVEDVDRAIRLVNISLSQAGMDIETGKVDVDKIMVGTTKSQRDKINIILDIVRGLEKEYGMAKRAEIIEMAEQEGISRENAEELIDMLKKRAELYEPKHDSFKIV